MADLGDFFDKCNEIFHLNSPVPKDTLEEDCILGIDEAGRGPVLGKTNDSKLKFISRSCFSGPMVYAAAYYPAKKQKNLQGDKFQDSKTLTEKERTSMFKKINEYEIGWSATVLSPIVISNCMLKR